MTRSAARRRRPGCRRYLCLRSLPAPVRCTTIRARFASRSIKTASCFEHCRASTCFTVSARGSPVTHCHASLLSRNRHSLTGDVLSHVSVTCCRLSPGAQKPALTTGLRRTDHAHSASSTGARIPRRNNARAEHRNARSRVGHRPGATSRTEQGPSHHRAACSQRPSRGEVTIVQPPGRMQLHEVRDRLRDTVAHRLAGHLVCTTQQRSQR